ncbi:hypothetical protein HAZT_HAZT010312 [Hyalella azteca]|uniref:Fibrinogen C-terminal domain-containing protein n=1 Tax=Hyalella azteca TaxID=294128 RepID=A0A6A0GS92_HYAAZ|nr:hypothetical protein HAZT_HAZT010312 [Hyalella azteca]
MKISSVPNLTRLELLHWLLRVEKYEMKLSKDKVPLTPADCSERPEKTSGAPFTPADCSERPEKTSGVYTIYPSGAAVQVYCDQTTDGGGWTVFLRRQKQEPQLNFSRTFKEYEGGFGSPSGEYWLGLRNLHFLTSQKQYELRVLVARGTESASSHYKKFQVGAGDSYKLHVEGYDKERSTAGDSFTYHSGRQFSAIDRDRDMAEGGSCSEWSGGGGWWYDYCFITNPTGLFGGDKPAHEDSDLYLEWRYWQGYYAYLSELTFMIRPKTLELG